MGCSFHRRQHKTWNRTSEGAKHTAQRQFPFLPFHRHAHGTSACVSPQAQSFWSSLDHSLRVHLRHSLRSPRFAFSLDRAAKPTTCLESKTLDSIEWPQTRGTAHLWNLTNDLRDATWIASSGMVPSHPFPGARLDTGKKPRNQARSSETQPTAIKATRFVAAWTRGKRA